MKSSKSLLFCFHGDALTERETVNFGSFSN